MMIATIRSVTVFAVILGGAFPALGQAPPAIPGFSEVRLTSAEYSGAATLLSIGPESLELGIEGQAQSFFVPMATLARLEYRRPATARERLTRGALWGAGTLGVSGFLLTDRGEDTSEVEAALYSVLAGVLWGGAIGLLIPQSRWERVDLVDW